ncbi:MAG TPA: GNAT family N-acetyltransferase [Sphingomicrobium sp.]|nr:GNAT family N-acetyltransferase [Sphingomicrobium sp.]
MEAPSEIIVRRAADSDLDAVAHVWHESALVMDGDPHVPAVEALRSRIESELQSGWDLHVALRGERVVGLLAVKPSEALLDQIFVLPSEQGQGVGRALLEVAQRTMPAGFRLRMATANDRARGFYEAEGLKLLGEGFHPWSGVPVQFYGWNIG